MNQAKKMALQHADLPQGLSFSAILLPLSKLREAIVTIG
jgi:hypothetical protein